MKMPLRDHERFMQAALREARDALAAGEFPVGCVLVCQDRIVARGSRTGSAGSAPNEIDHAEIHALRRLYDLGEAVDRSQVALYCTLEPCLMCFGAVLLSGIQKIVYAFEDVMGGGTACDRTVLPPLYQCNPVEIVAGVLRSESLGLLQRFFGDPQNAYWRGSSLAEYTLNQ